MNMIWLASGYVAGESVRWAFEEQLSITPGHGGPPWATLSYWLTSVEEVSQGLCYGTNPGSGLESGGSLHGGPCRPKHGSFQSRVS